MADLNITSVRVADNRGNIFSGEAGQAVGAGVPIRRDFDLDGELVPGIASHLQSHAQISGITLTAGLITGEVPYVVGHADLDFGVALERGMTYVLSHNLGKIMPITDLRDDDYLTYLFYALNESVGRLMIHPTTVKADPFEFSDIEGLQLWLRADRGVFTDNDMLIPAANDDDRIRRWVSQINSEDIFIPLLSSDGYRPFYKKAVSNGRDVLRATGTTHMQTHADINPIPLLEVLRGVPGTTVFVVVRYGSEGFVGEAPFIFNTESAIQIPRLRISDNTSDTLLCTAINNAQFASSSGGAKDDSLFIIHAGVVDFAGGSVTCRLNGEDQTPAALANPQNADDVQSRYCSLFAGCTGDIAEILLWNRELTTDEINEVEAKLASQYNITLP